MSESDSPAPANILVVEARFYEDIADELLRGATAELSRHDASFDRVTVPGAFEVPAAIQMAVRSREFFAGRPRFDGYVALGCVIRGQTTHYQYICAETARKLQDLACQYALALGYGILTCENRDQAWERASVAGRDKGGAAARACLEMLAVKRRFHLYPR